MKNQRLLVYLMASAIIATTAHAVSAASFVSAASGEWNNASTWNVAGIDADGIPDADDDVQIGSNHIVSIEGYNAQALSFTITDALLNFNGNGMAPTLEVGTDITINNGGRLDVLEGPGSSPIELKTNNLFINNGGILNGNGSPPNPNRKVIISGDLMVAAGGSLNHGGYLYVFTGPGDSNIGGDTSPLTLSGLRIEGNTTLTLQRPLHMLEHNGLGTGNSGIVITNGAVLTPNGQTITMENSVFLRNNHHLNGFNDPGGTSTLLYKGPGMASIESDSPATMTIIGNLSVETNDRLTIRNKITLKGDMHIGAVARVLVENPPAGLTEIFVEGDWIMDANSHFDAINREGSVDYGEGSVVIFAYDGDSIVNIDPGVQRAAFSHIRMMAGAQLLDISPNAIVYFQELFMQHKATITAHVAFAGANNDTVFGYLVGATLHFTDGGDMATGSTIITVKRISEMETGNPSTQDPLKEFWTIDSDHDHEASNSTMEVANLTLQHRCANHNSAHVVGPFVLGEGFQTSGRDGSSPRTTNPKWKATFGTVTRNDIKPFVTPLLPAAIESNDPVMWTYNCGPSVGLSVELIAFDAEYNPSTSAVVLQWETAGEIDNAGFRVYAADISEDGTTTIGEQLTEHIIPAVGSAATGGTYHFVDPRPINLGEIVRAYYLEDINLVAVSTLHEPAVAQIPRHAGGTLEATEQLLAVLSPDTWQSASPLGGVSLSGDDSGGLVIRAEENGASGFGFWEISEELPPLPPGLYRVTVNVEPLSADGYLLPEIRIRAFQVNHERGVAANAAHMAQDRPAPEVVEAIFESDGENSWKIAFDIIATEENQGGGYRIKKVEVAPAN